MRKWGLALLGLLWWTGAAWAANPGIDASGFCHNGTQAVVTTYTLSCSTTTAGDEFVLFCRTVRTGAAAPTCTPTSSGEIWTRRVQRTNSYDTNGCDTNGACQDDAEVWTAPISGTWTTHTITITLSGSAFNTAFAQGIGITNANIFDTNGSLPASANNLDNTSAAVQVTGVSTTSPASVLLAFVGTNFPAGWNGVDFAAAGATANDVLYCQSFFGGCNGQLVSQGLHALAVTSVQSGITVCAALAGTCTVSKGWVVIADSTVVAPTIDGLLLRGVGQ